MARRPESARKIPAAPSGPGGNRAFPLPFWHRTGQHRPVASGADVMLERSWTLLKDTVLCFIEDGAMSRGAAIAYYTVFSIAPLLVIATAIAGLVFEQAAVEGVVADQLRGLLGDR